MAMLMIPADGPFAKFTQHQIADISEAMKDRMDKSWIAIKTELPQFQQLANVMGTMLAIPHSSSSCE